MEKNLLAYAAAAGAAGVALLACAVPAQAEIIATKVNVKLPIAKGLVQFDINGDGQPDFGLSAFGETHTCTQGRITHHSPKRLLGCPFDDGVAIVPTQAGDEVWQAGTSYGNKCAASVAGGQNIGNGRPFGSGRALLGVHEGTSEGFYYCPWAKTFTPHPFLGIKFTDTTGNIHYGWINIRVIGINRATVTGFAYETVPNQPIRAGSTSGPNAAKLSDPTDLTPQAPEVASLGRLAEGASGLSAWRRRSRPTETYTSAPIG